MELVQGMPITEVLPISAKLRIVDRLQLFAAGLSMQLQHAHQKGNHASGPQAVEYPGDTSATGVPDAPR